MKRFINTTTTIAAYIAIYIFYNNSGVTTDQKTFLLYLECALLWLAIITYQFK